MKTTIKNISKKFAIIILTIILCISSSLVLTSQKAYAGWAFGDYDQD